MWVCALSVLLIGVLEVKGEIDCNKGKRQCELHMKGREGISQTAEEFDHQCPYLIAYKQCYVDYADVCGEEENVHGGVSFFRGSLPFLKDACVTGSNTHANVVKHFDCFLKNLRNQNEACQETAEHALKNYIGTQKISGYKALDRSRCYRFTSEAACFIDEVEEKCADGAKPFVFDVLQRTKYVHLMCEKENTEKILELLDSLELKPSIKESIKKLIAF